MNADNLLRGLPGEEIVREGLDDYQAGRRTIPSCLVAIGRPRLSRTGVFTADLPAARPEPELALYELLRAMPGDAYSGYNSWIRRLVSLERALEHRVRTNRAPESSL